MLVWVFHLRHRIILSIYQDLFKFVLNHQIITNKLFFCFKKISKSLKFYDCQLYIRIFQTLMDYLMYRL